MSDTTKSIDELIEQSVGERDESKNDTNRAVPSVPSQLPGETRTAYLNRLYGHNVVVSLSKSVIWRSNS